MFGNHFRLNYTNKSDYIRQEAIKYLGLVSIDSPSLKKECFVTLENLLVSDEGVEIKCEAAKALGKIKLEKGLTIKVDIRTRTS